MKTTKFLLGLFIAIFAFSACHKDDDSNDVTTTVQYLTKVTETNIKGEKTTTSIEYNSNNKVQKVTVKDSTTTTYKYEYDSNGKLSKKIIIIGDSTSYNTYSWNDNQITIKTFASLEDDNPSLQTISTLDANGMVKESLVKMYFFATWVDLMKFYYTNVNNNTTKIETESLISNRKNSTLNKYYSYALKTINSKFPITGLKSINTKTTLLTAEYDGNNNPYRNRTFDINSFNFLGNSANNVIKLTTYNNDGTSKTITIKYEYKNEYPSTGITKDDKDNKISDIVYEYK